MTNSSLHTPQLHLWLDRVQAGDRAAREELLQCIAHRVERLARKMLGRFPSVQGWAETGDVMQSAVLRLLRALEEVRPPSKCAANCSTWHDRRAGRAACPSRRAIPFRIGNCS